MPRTHPSSTGLQIQRVTILALVATFSLSLPLSILASEVPTATAEGVGISAERLKRVTQLGQSMVDAGQVAGIVIQVARHGKIIHTDIIGTRGLDDPRPLESDALFRIYSMSKPITAVAAMMLYEEGKFHLRDPVSKFVSELKELIVLKDGRYVRAENEMTMHHLLTHTAGLSYGFAANNPVDIAYRKAQLFRSHDLDDFARRLGELPLMYEPGFRWHYSVAVDVTGLVVQRLAGMGFDEFLRTRLFEPLDMPDTFFTVPEDKRDRFLPNHTWNAESNVMETLENSELDPGYFDSQLFLGGSGLVSTTRDYMRFAEMLRDGGELQGVRILSPKTVDFLRQDHTMATSSELRQGGGVAVRLIEEAPGLGFGLGFGVVTDTVRTQVMRSEGEYYWGGAAGTVFWIDPVEEIVVVAMIQLMRSPWPMRENLRIAVYQALEESLAN